MVVRIEVRRGREMLCLELVDFFILKLKFNEDGRLRKKLSYLHEHETKLNRIFFTFSEYKSLFDYYTLNCKGMKI